MQFVIIIYLCDQDHLYQHTAWLAYILDLVRRIKPKSLDYILSDSSFIIYHHIYYHIYYLL